MVNDEHLRPLSLQSQGRCDGLRNTQHASRIACCVLRGQSLTQPTTLTEPLPVLHCPPHGGGHCPDLRHQFGKLFKREALRPVRYGFIRVGVYLNNQAIGAGGHPG